MWGGPNNVIYDRRQTDGSFMVSADGRCRRPRAAETKTQSLAWYDGAKPCKHLKTITAILTCISAAGQEASEGRAIPVLRGRTSWYQPRHMQPNSGRSGASSIDSHWCRTVSCYSSPGGCWQMHARASCPLLKSVTNGPVEADAVGTVVTE